MTFIDHDGDLLRDFDSINEMNHTIIENWNRVVGPKDIVVHLGDVVFGKRNLFLLSHLNGRKILVKGNHDHFPIQMYLEHFEDIRAMDVRKKENILFTHLPVHFSEMFWCGRNAHGHTHDRILPDERYMNMCVECIDYTPMEIEEVMARFEMDLDNRYRF
jgi:calcineurin-like phosphoesterase family protein